MLNDKQKQLLEELNSSVKKVDTDRFLVLVNELKESTKGNELSQIEEVYRKLNELKINLENEMKTLSDILIEKKNMSQINKKYNTYR